MQVSEGQVAINELYDIATKVLLEIPCYFLVGSWLGRDVSLLVRDILIFRGMEAGVKVSISHKEKTDRICRFAICVIGGIAFGILVAPGLSTAGLLCVLVGTELLKRAVLWFYEGIDGNSFRDRMYELTNGYILSRDDFKKLT